MHYIFTQYHIEFVITNNQNRFSRTEMVDVSKCIYLDDYLDHITSSAMVKCSFAIYITGIVKRIYAPNGEVIEDINAFILSTEDS